MPLFKRKPRTMEQLLASNGDFNGFVHEVMYHIWFRHNLAQGSLDDQINMLWNYYEQKTQPSQVAHELLQAELDLIQKMKGDNTNG